MNLLCDPWIPTDAGPASVMQLLETPQQFNLELGGMRFAAVLRLLLAVCYTGGETSQGLMRRRAVQKGTLTRLEHNRSAFDLYHGGWICEDLSGHAGTLNCLVSSAPVRNNRVFHVHARDDHPVSRPPEVIACDLLAFQLSALEFGHSAAGRRHHSPCATAALGIAVGANLLETLALNLIPDSTCPEPCWKWKPITMDDVLNQTRSLPTNIAGRYTWVAQAVRFVDRGVVTARGFKLKPLGDPMTATVTAKEGQPFASKAVASNAWLTGCRLIGWDAQPAATLQHAKRLKVAHTVRVIAQVNDPKRAAVLVETIDQTFPRKALNLKIASQVLRAGWWLGQSLNEDVSTIFLSRLEDAVRETSKVDLHAILERSLEDVGARAFLPRVEQWLEVGG